MGTSAAMIISAIIAAATAVGGAAAQSAEVDKANRTNQRLAAQSRADTLAQQQFQNAQSYAQLGLQRRGVALSERQQGFQEAMGREGLIRQSIQGNWERGLQIVNSNSDLANRMSTIFNRRVAA